MYYELVDGRRARGEEWYEDGAFILENAEESYDDGWWAMPEVGHALWFTTWNDAVAYINAEGGQLLPKDDVRDLARDFIGQSIDEPVAGETIDRAQLAQQLRSAGDAITDADVEAVATEIERIINS